MSDSDVETSVHGGVYHRGNFEYNGEGMIIGFAHERKDSSDLSPTCGKRKLRTHKTVDCAFLTDSEKSSSDDAPLE
ncbi:hypothetical protein SPRG_19745 [Saprolegnia parasitica CBS 223.65]|uniref:Uncharacterized protein n=1 Tax=Saprolegnia parasitica (strain CBS 223.65) TaxID=695850 RepID=A0A067CH91_SAPPC|nr:hypothetical protein SPRG_19745 [Saprolegnia parasitica CBS 223.65]KDO29868.1 hypothetical protein SPRG_19745 [Saprolegnia parasitica CBS 223.65]|eukprot:XP_012199564.1 hypothetical protein SPRG_19745 [Saprolegnia parasitica CBS 223.65]